MLKFIFDAKFTLCLFIVASRKKVAARNVGGSSTAPPSEHEREEEFIDEEEWDRTTFASLKCEKFYKESVRKRSIVKEGWFTGLAEQRIDRLTDGKFKVMLEKPEWGYEEITKEIVANWNEAEESKVFLRGKTVQITPKIINMFYNLRTYAEGTTELEQAKLRDDFYDEALAYLRVEGDQTPWTLHINRKPKSVETGILRADAKLILRFVKSRIYPNTHTGEMKPEEAAMVYAILRQWTVNIGHEIYKSITRAASQLGTKGIPFPFLISSICRKQLGDIFRDLPCLTPGKGYKTTDYQQYVREEASKREELRQRSQEPQDDTDAAPARGRRNVRAQAPRQADEGYAALQAQVELQNQEIRRTRRDLRHQQRLIEALLQSQGLHPARERTPDTP